jgi:ribonuclease VapC
MIIIDASALLAFLFRETGHEKAAEYLPDSALSTVNLSEVLARFARDGHDVHQVWQQIAASPIQIVPFSAQTAVLAAALSLLTKPLGLSLADRACLALAVERKAPVLTADQAWLQLDIGINIISIR